MIVDTHVHYGIWSGGDFPIEELLANAAEAGIDRIVQVTNSKAVWDNAPSLAGWAAHPDKVVGVIGRFDPVSPDVERRLKECMAPAGMLGFRLQPQAGAETWLRDGVYDATFAAAEKLDTAVLLLAPYEVPLMREKVRRYPGARFLIDHLGLKHKKGASLEDTFRQWPDLIGLASEPNAWIKVSLFPEAVNGLEEYPYPVALDHFKQLYEGAGGAKLVWGSNYAPVTKACTYKQSVDFVREHATFLSSKDRDAILGGNFMEHFGPNRSA